MAGVDHSSQVHMGLKVVGALSKVGDMVLDIRTGVEALGMALMVDPDLNMDSRAMDQDLEDMVEVMEDIMAQWVVDHLIHNHQGMMGILDQVAVAHLHLLDLQVDHQEQEDHQVLDRILKSPQIMDHQEEVMEMDMEGLEVMVDKAVTAAKEIRHHHLADLQVRILDIIHIGVNLHGGEEKLLLPGKCGLKFNIQHFYWD